MDPVGLAALSELAVDPACDLGVLDAIAEHVWEMRRGPDVEGLAQGQDVRVTYAHELPRPFRALLVDGEIIVRPNRDPAQTRVAIAHELAHHTATKAGLCLAHPDVWRLTLAILVPPRAIAQTTCAGDLAAATGAPWWAVEYRLRLLDAA